MKKILITGANSYVGTSFKNWVSQFLGEYKIDVISLRDEDWRKKSFKNYDVVLHTVGIAHVDAKPEMEELYYKVNRDLAIDTANKAKKDQVKHFIFLSSIIVYGDSSRLNKLRIIDKDTEPQPANFYGNSKLQAEKGIKLLETDNFKIAIVRPPMIYGKNSKGNYQKLAKIAKKTPFFPDIENQRSMLHIDNLSEFLRLIIDNEDRGIFFPQNKEYVSTSNMVKLISESHKKKIKLTKIFNPSLLIASKKYKIINKVFGGMVYDLKLSEYKDNYRVRSLKESIQLTEGEN